MATKTTKQLKRGDMVLSNGRSRTVLSVSCMIEGAGGMSTFDARSNSGKCSVIFSDNSSLSVPPDYPFQMDPTANRTAADVAILNKALMDAEQAMERYFNKAIEYPDLVGPGAKAADLYMRAQAAMASLRYEVKATTR
jgi:hypothetical protein